MSAARVLVTRPLGQQQALIAALEQAGFVCVHAPLLEILPLSAPDAEQRRILLGLSEYQHVIFVSRNAIRHGMDWIEDFWPQLPAGLNWYTVGESSARLLSEYGIDARRPQSSMDSEGLLALPALRDAAGERVLIVKGEGGRDTLRQTLESRGARVEELAVYRRGLPDYADDELGGRILDNRCQYILLSSGEGLNNMVSLLDESSLARVRELTLIVPGQRVADLASAAGFRHVVVAGNATDDAMVVAVSDAHRQRQAGM